VPNPQHDKLHPLNPQVPPGLQDRLAWLPDTSRNMGIHVMAGRGSGKSRLMGRGIAWLDFIRNIPLVILDPAGPTIDNLLDKILRLPQDLQEKLWKRVVYVDMSAQGERVVPFPVYFRFGHESSFEVSQRFLDTIRSIDPYLMTASIQGWNPLWRIGTYSGMLLSALDCQITEAEHLLRTPGAWQSVFARAVANQPDVQPAVDFFSREYQALGHRERDQLTSSYLTKIGVFSLDPSLQAMFGAASAGIDWETVIAKRQAVLLDFRHVADVEQRRLKMMWAFQYLYAFIKYRGAGRHTPISVMIDELTALSNFRGGGESIFAKTLDELINVYARNCMVWLTISHQELFQLDEQTQKTLMSLGTQILGVTSDGESALQLAKQLLPIDPLLVKRYDPMYASSMGVSEIIDYRPVEFSVQEQQLLSSEHFKNLRLFEFLVRIAKTEGDISGRLRKVHIKNFDKGIWVDEPMGRQLRAQLRSRGGIRKTDVRAAIAARVPGANAILNTRPYANDIPAPDTDDEEDDLREATGRA